jgi:hypothetical protein
MKSKCIDSSQSLHTHLSDFRFSYRRRFLKMGAVCSTETLLPITVHGVITTKSTIWIFVSAKTSIFVTESTKLDPLTSFGIRCTALRVLKQQSLFVLPLPRFSTPDAHPPGARGGAVGWCTVLKAGMSPFLMESLAFFTDLILPATLWPWVRLSL